MKKIILTVIALFIATHAWAARPLPANLVLGTLTGSDGATLTFAPRASSLLGRLVGLVLPDSVSVPLTPALRVYDPDNRLVLQGQINDYAGNTVGVTFDFQGNLNRIWVLTGDELATLTQ